jgi:excisionase family DNA binding protein
MAQMNRMDYYLTPRELARLLNVHINTVRRWSDRGVLKAHRIGPRGDRRFSKEDIAEFLAGNGNENGNGSFSAKPNGEHVLVTR